MPSSAPPAETAATVAVRVWDLPTRLFHWALTLCLVGSLTTASVGGLAMIWHFRFGYAIVTLLLFRLVWGLVGGHWSRFASFIYSPATVWRYLRGEASPRPWLDVGHSPLGSLSVFALLTILALQVGSGLFADDEIAFAGPLSHLVSGSTVGELTSYHKGIGKSLVIALVALHIVAILVYAVWLRRTLVGPMVHGDKRLAPGVPPARDSAGTRVMALVILAICAALVAWVVSPGF